MPTISQIRDAIAGKIAAVPGSGVVHGFQRYAKREADFRQLYEDAGTIRGWYVRRTGTDESSGALGRTTVVHRWRVQGYRALDDATQSERDFDELVETVRDAFRADETLGGVVATTVVGEQAGLQVEDSGPVMFAGVLSHGVRCALLTRHYLGEAP